MLETPVFSLPDTMYVMLPTLRVGDGVAAPVAFFPFPESICADCDPLWENGI